VKNITMIAQTGIKTENGALLDKQNNNQRLYTIGKPLEKTSFGIDNQGYRKKPINMQRSKAEFLFGFRKQSMNALALKTLANARASVINALAKRPYNLFRLDRVVRLTIIQISN
jgi:hypothetical protein